MSETPNLSGPHLDTLSQLFRHPTSHNIEWHDVLSLLEAVGTVEEHNDGRYHVAIGSESTVVARPLHKDIDMSTVAELRTVLRNAGLAPGEQT
ncbi:MAG TPA: hypothetical protein VFV02_16330 [Acidimicrobiales bacterium]|nr:hypothetical protein [Acidimicrobiales bacterium]